MVMEMRSRTPSSTGLAFESSIASAGWAQLPPWLKDLKESALQRHQQLGLPTRRQESWRFVDLSPLTDRAYAPLSGSLPTLPPQALEAFLHPESNEFRLVFLNGRYVPTLSSVASLPPGAIITELSQAISEYPELVQPYLDTEIGPESMDTFHDLNTAAFEHGVFMYLPDNTVLETPIQIMFVIHNLQEAPLAVYPRGLFIIGQSAQVTVTTTYLGLPESEHYLNNSVFQWILKENAQLNWMILQTESPNSVHLASTALNLAQDSQANIFTTTFGGQLSRQNLHVRLLGDNAHCALNGLSVLNGTSQGHDRTQIDHVSPHCCSEQLYKSILADQSRSEFDGTIVIHRGAALSQADQLNRTLLLSDEAKVHTRPQLRIDNDDVKCSHGATVGQLNEDELFYLASRGLSEQLSRTLLTLGFAGEIIEKIPVQSMQQHLRALVSQQLNASETKQTLKTGGS